MASGAISGGPSTVADQFSIRVCVAERGLSAVTVIPVSCSWAVADIFVDSGAVLRLSKTGFECGVV